MPIKKGALITYFLLMLLAVSNCEKPVVPQAQCDVDCHHCGLCVFSLVCWRSCVKQGHNGGRCHKWKCVCVDDCPKTTEQSLA